MHTRSLPSKRGQLTHATCGCTAALCCDAESVQVGGATCKGLS